MDSQSDSAGDPLADHQDDTPLPRRSRSEVVRDVLVFQLKLFVDGLRDLILSPVSLVLGLVGVFVSREPGEPFYRLLRAGRASEHWIDLFGAAYPDDRQPVEPEVRAQEIQKEFDQHLRGLEKSLKNADYDQAARASAERLRALWKRHGNTAGGTDAAGDDAGGDANDETRDRGRPSTPPEDSSQTKEN